MNFFDSLKPYVVWYSRCPGFVTRETAKRQTSTAFYLTFVICRKTQSLNKSLLSKHGKTFGIFGFKKIYHTF